MGPNELVIVSMEFSELSRCRNQKASIGPMIWFHSHFGTYTVLHSLTGLLFGTGHGRRVRIGSHGFGGSWSHSPCPDLGSVVATIPPPIRRSPDGVLVASNF
jgi:hypothetical protein